MLLIHANFLSRIRERFLIVVKQEKEKEEIDDEVLGELCQYIKLFEENIKGIE